MSRLEWQLQLIYDARVVDGALRSDLIGARWVGATELIADDIDPEARPLTAPP